MPKWECGDIKQFSSDTQTGNRNAIEHDSLLNVQQQSDEQGLSRTHFPVGAQQNLGTAEYNCNVSFFARLRLYCLAQPKFCSASIMLCKNFLGKTSFLSSLSGYSLDGEAWKRAILMKRYLKKSKQNLVIGNQRQGGKILTRLLQQNLTLYR